MEKRILNGYEIVEDPGSNWSEVLERMVAVEGYICHPTEQPDNWKLMLIMENLPSVKDEYIYIKRLFRHRDPLGSFILPDIETYFFVDKREKCVWIISYPGIDLKNAVPLLGLDFNSLARTKQRVSLHSAAFIMKQLFEAVAIGLGKTSSYYCGHFGTTEVTNYAMVDRESCRLIWTNPHSVGVSEFDIGAWYKNSHIVIGKTIVNLLTSCSSESNNFLSISACLSDEYTDPTPIENARLFKAFVARLAKDELSHDDRKVIEKRFPIIYDKALCREKSDREVFNKLYKKFWQDKTPALQIIPLEYLNQPETGDEEWYTVDPFLSAYDDWNTAI